MIILPENTEILSQDHQMWAEGTSDLKPKQIDIELFLTQRNFTSTNVDIWFDNLQGFWRWSCDISK